MAVQIQLKRGTSAPSAGSFAVGEPAWDATNGRLYVKNTAGSMVEINPAANAVTDAAQSFTKAQRGSIVTLTDGATVTQHCEQAACAEAVLTVTARPRA